jgi:hypothetical protein
MQALQGLWMSAGLEAVETREITVHRTFADFDDFWMTEIKSPAVAPVVATMTPGDAEKLKGRVRARLPADTEGRITYGARAHATFSPAECATQSLSKDWACPASQTE